MKAKDIEREGNENMLRTKNLPYNLTGFLTKKLDVKGYYFSLYGIDFEIGKREVESKEIAEYIIIGVISTMDIIKYNIGLY